MPAADSIDADTMDSHLLLTIPAGRTKTQPKRHFAGFTVQSARKAVSLLLAAQFVISAPAAFSYSSEVTVEEARVEHLTNVIFHKLVDLERYYLRYRQVGTATPKFRRMRYFLLQVASTSCTLASNIMLTDVAHKGLKDKVTNFGRGDADVDQPNGSSGSSQNTGVSPPAPGVADTNGEVRGALVLALVGTILGPGSSLLELCSNGFTAVKNLKQGKNPASAVKHVTARMLEIDALMTERKKIIDEHPELRALQINMAEHVVLECFRDWCVGEFVDVYSDVKSGQSAANVFYMLDVTNGALSMAGQILGLKSLHPGRDNLAGPSAVVSIVGDCFSIVSAPASAYAGKKMKSYWKKRMQKKFNEQLKFGETETKASMATLQSFVNAADDATYAASGEVISRLAAYSMWCDRYDDIIDRGEAELKHRSKVAHQGQRMGPLLGGAGLTQDLLAGVAFYGYPNNDRRGASLAYAGSITAVNGNAAALAYTNYNLVSEYLYKRKLRAKGLLPQQLQEERLRLLDQIDLMLPKQLNESN